MCAGLDFPITNKERRIKCAGRRGVRSKPRVYYRSVRGVPGLSILYIPKSKAAADCPRILISQGLILLRFLSE